MQNVTLVGYLAALCSMTSFAPQAWKIIRTRDTNSISAPMYAMTVAGFLLWLVFGIMKSEGPIIITNGVCLLLSAFILLMTVLPRRRKEQIADALDPKDSGTASRMGMIDLARAAEPRRRRGVAPANRRRRRAFRLMNPG